jgi:hypothetical protein
MHQGELLREDVLPALGRTRTEIADLDWLDKAEEDEIAAIPTLAVE